MRGNAVPIPGFRTGALAFLACGLAACASTPEAAEARARRETRLTQALAALAPAAPPGESRRLAETAVEKAAQLRQTYRIGLGHNLHNVMVYWGLKGRGFCYHWQTDLDSALADVPHPSFDVRRIWAYPGSLWHEHHALVVTPTGGDWREGLVLDGWRDEGVLWFGKVREDDYPWVTE